MLFTKILFGVWGGESFFVGLFEVFWGRRFCLAFLVLLLGAKAPLGVVCTGSWLQESPLRYSSPQLGTSSDAAGCLRIVLFSPR